MSSETHHGQQTVKEIAKIVSLPGIIGVLFGVLVGGIPSYMYLIGQSVSREEMERYVKEKVEQAPFPYNDDKGEIKAFMRREEHNNTKQRS